MNHRSPGSYFKGRKGWMLFVPSFLRRLFLSRQGAGLLFASFMGVILVAIELTMPQITHHLRISVTDTLRPFFTLTSFVTHHGTEAINALRNYQTVADLRDRLVQQDNDIRRLRAEAMRLREDNATLRRMVNYKPNDRDIDVSSGRIVARSHHGGSHFVVLNIGRNHGIEREQAVMAGEGLIGRVVAVGDGTSRVQLIHDVHSRVPVMVDGTKDHGILTGHANGDLTIEYLSPHHRLSVDDKVVTSGEGGVFPKGVAVGRVSRIVGGSVYVTPFVQADQVDYVYLMDTRPQTAMGFVRSPFDLP